MYFIYLKIFHKIEDEKPTWSVREPWARLEDIKEANEVEGENGMVHGAMGVGP